MATTNPTTLTLYVSSLYREGSVQGVPATFNWGSAPELLHGQTVASASISVQYNGAVSTDLTVTAASIDMTGLLVQTLVSVATANAANRQYTLVCKVTLTDGTSPELASLNVVVSPL